jgi:hypothetical protein
MFRKAQEIKQEVKQQVISKVADNISTHIVETGKEKLKDIASSCQQSTPNSQTPQQVSSAVQSAKQTTVEKVEQVKSLVNSVRSGESSSVKEAIEEKVDVKINMCVAGMLVTFLVGFFVQLEYVKPIHPVLSVPVFSILAFSTCYYVMRYLTKDIKVRVGVTIFSGLFVGASARYLSIKLGQYQLITEDQPFLLVPLLGVCTVSFIGLFKYIFEISKKFEERWQMFKTD